MASLQGLPPLPKSLSALLNFTSAQWKEMERIHTMRTMIQQDLNRSTYSGPGPSGHQGQTNSGIAQQQMQSRTSGAGGAERSLTPPVPPPKPRKPSNLDAQLAHLRREMVGLRQLDMSLLCQLWSLNETIQNYKHVLQASSPGWDNGYEHDSSGDEAEAGSPTQTDFDRRVIIRRRRRLDLNVVQESLSSSSSHSSLEFGNI